MDGMELWSSELAYLCALHGVNAPVGLDLSAVIPTDPASLDRLYAEGLQQLRQHGWLRPTDRAGQWRPDDTLFGVATTVSHPSHVVLTWRNDPHVFVAHYLDKRAIVELSSPVTGRFRLGLVDGVSALADRVSALFAFDVDDGPSIAVEAESLDEAAGLARTGATAAAADHLARSGADGASARLVESLAITGGEVVVGRVRGGAIDAARRAVLYGPRAEWMTARAPGATGLMRVAPRSPRAMNHWLAESLQLLAE